MKSLASFSNTCLSSSPGCGALSFDDIKNHPEADMNMGTRDATRRIAAILADNLVVPTFLADMPRL